MGDKMNKENERRKLLGEEPVGKLLLKFSLPAMTGMIVNALYNVVDRIFIGKGLGDIGYWWNFYWNAHIFDYNGL